MSSDASREKRFMCDPSKVILVKTAGKILFCTKAIWKEQDIRILETWPGIWNIRNKEREEGGRMSRGKKMTYSFYVSIEGGEPINMDDMEEEEREEIKKKLCRQLIEKGLGGEVITA